jgi:hypothetical protein
VEESGFPGPRRQGAQQQRQRAETCRKERRVADGFQRLRRDRRPGCQADDEGPRLRLALAQNPKHLPAAKEGGAGGKVGQIGQGKQQDNDVLQHAAVPIRLPVTHSVLRFGRASMGEVSRAWTDFGEEIGKMASRA